MTILGLLASISAAYDKAAKFVASKAVPEVKVVPSSFHTVIGAVAGVIVTVVGGFLYYLFGSSSDACKGAPSSCVARRDWLIIPSFVILQFSAIVILALLQLLAKKADDSKKRDILPISWFVYGLCLGLSLLLGLLVLFDTYVMNSWLVLPVMIALFGFFSYLHASYWYNATKKQ